jgi:chromate transport protein ChrA
MISTVTTTTVSTVTTTTGMAATLGGIAVAALVAFLVAKELASADGRPQLQRLSRVLNIAIVPLLVVFGAVVVAKVVEVL